VCVWGQVPQISAIAVPRRSCLCKQCQEMGAALRKCRSAGLYQTGLGKQTQQVVFLCIMHMHGSFDQRRQICYMIKADGVVRIRVVVPLPGGMQ
jgi:hypothetical protein